MAEYILEKIIEARDATDSEQNNSAVLRTAEAYTGDWKYLKQATTIP